MLAFSVLFCCAVCLIANKLHHAEGRDRVKSILLFDIGLKMDERNANSGSNMARCVRTRSKRYETVGTGGVSTGEDFQNTGTFIVVRSSVFAKSSAHNTHLARDAHNAVWDLA